MSGSFRCGLRSNPRGTRNERDRDEQVSEAGVRSESDLQGPSASEAGAALLRLRPIPDTVPFLAFADSGPAFSGPGSVSVSGTGSDRTSAAPARPHRAKRRNLRPQSVTDFLRARPCAVRPNPFDVRSEQGDSASV